MKRAPQTLFLVAVVALVGFAKIEFNVLGERTALHVLATMGRRAWIAFTPNAQIKRVTKFGYNLDIDTGVNESVSAIGDDARNRFNLNAETLSIVSTSADDAAAGIGARSISIQCIGADGTQSEVPVTMNGLTPVLTTDLCKFNNRAVVISSGSSRKNIGDITVTQTLSGVVLALIPANKSVTQQLEYYVPSDRECFIDRLLLKGRKLATGTARMDIGILVFSQVTMTDYEIRDYLIDTNGDGFIERENFKAERLSPNEIFSVDVSTNANNSAITGSIDMTCRVMNQ